MVASLIAEVFSWDSFGSVTPALLEDKLFNVNQVGYIVGAGHILSFLSKLLLGKAADKFNARKTFLCVMFLQGVGALCFGFSRNLPGIVFSFYLIKIASAGAWSCMTKLIGNWYEPELYGLIWGVVSITTTFLSIITYSIIGSILTHMSWQWVYWSMSIVFMVITLILCFIVWDDPTSLGLPPLVEFIQNRSNEDGDDDDDVESISFSSDRESEGHPLEGLSLKEAIHYYFDSPQFWAMCLGLLSVTCAASFESSISLYLTARYKLPPGSAATATAAYAVGTCVAVAFGAFVYSKFSKMQLFLINMLSLLLSLVDLILLWLLPPETTSIYVAVFLIFMFGVGITIPWYYPSSIYSIESGGKDHSGILSGALDGLSNLGLALFSFICWELLDDGDWDSFFIMMGWSVIGSITFLGLFLWMDAKKKSKYDLNWDGLVDVIWHTHRI
eukprot:TRINITY_DN6579_c0_g1_i1.p1 TRINITY_DN6579_c0_g1~~TRINITY_DN6579_c0_g1_i1.p1  ORF type:complete len:492 (+),score=110.76 TRINITY_DN6579_c0_g1_i1:147-1478(+)